MASHPFWKTRLLSAARGQGLTTRTPYCSGSTFDSETFHRKQKHQAGRDELDEKGVTPSTGRLGLGCKFHVTDPDIPCWLCRHLDRSSSIWLMIEFGNFHPMPLPFASQYLFYPGSFRDNGDESRTNEVFVFHVWCFIARVFDCD